MAPHAIYTVLLLFIRGRGFAEYAYVFIVCFFSNPALPWLHIQLNNSSAFCCWTPPGSSSGPIRCDRYVLKGTFAVVKGVDASALSLPDCPQLLHNFPSILNLKGTAAICRWLQKIKTKHTENRLYAWPGGGKKKQFSIYSHVRRSETSPKAQIPKLVQRGCSRQRTRPPKHLVSLVPLRSGGILPPTHACFPQKKGSQTVKISLFPFHAELLL